LLGARADRVFCNAEAHRAAIAVVGSQGLPTGEAHIIRSVHAILIDFPRAEIVVRAEPEQAGYKVLAATWSAAFLEHWEAPSVRLAHPQPLRSGSLWLTLWQRLEILTRPVTTCDFGGLLRGFHNRASGPELPEIPDYSLTKELLEHLDPNHNDLH